MISRKMGKVGSCFMMPAVVLLLVLNLCNAASNQARFRQLSVKAEEGKEASSTSTSPYPLIFGDQYIPIIGILTKPNLDEPIKKFGAAMIPAEYVQWINSGGGRVMSIPYDADQDLLEVLFEQVNGLVFIGGETELIAPNQTTYYRAAKFLYELALEANLKGDYFPVWGTCLGFELMNIVQSGVKDGDHFKVLGSGFKSNNISLPLHFLNQTTDASIIGAAERQGDGSEIGGEKEWKAQKKQGRRKDSRIFRDVPEHIIQAAEKRPLTMNFHHNGISVHTYENEEGIHDFYDNIALSRDLNARPFLAVIEGKKWPFYAVQFHPEIPPYADDPYLQANRGKDSIELSFHLARFLVNEARLSNHRAFESDTKKTEHHLIYHCRRVPVQTLVFHTEVFFFDKCPKCICRA
eukprot:Nk52_evm32s62 gene=Nk52_evmTU32s62